MIKISRRVHGSAQGFGRLVVGVRAWVVVVAMVVVVGVVRFMLMLLVILL